MIKELTEQEALEVLEPLLEEDTYIDCGSSRAVYEINWKGRHCVVKIACDREGRLQNRIECGLFECTEGASFLGEIYAKYNDYFHIMEYVQPYNSTFIDRVSDGCIPECEEYDNYEYNTWDDRVITGTVHEDCGFKSLDDMIYECRKVEDVAYQLAQYSGDTADNYQIGKTADGRIVAYDYGYDTAYECCEQVGDINSFSNPVEYIYETLTEGFDIDRYDCYDDDEDYDDEEEIIEYE